ncbi:MULTISPECIES: LacI family DNA-binding transcriptional regulator [unclassified Rathayibacter]|uniref:LacI family DNA-binding transcriptional regulator n=1 Tax=unclassified Rathayibacter TaxID=2609250 RepID=UPI000CE8023C|nr:MULTISPECIES: LacI family DNA-binding transcriptional regulator [unclassified Rathayibacter]PPF28416.1 LacI family transcriptional regulator [Rathayibacter sp. AY1F2]PPH24135.1 LacI family transcriptional regulator [Rathayibacter sp. AY1C4]PPH48373.1 LacI family transcriptional regulator [Rathayibacter sp. AY1F7]
MTHDTASAAPTLEAVAALAGVSRATVSRVVNDSPRVKDGARTAVLAAIEQLGYVPNRAARSLASRRTQTVALVVPESAAKVFADPFLASVVQGAAMAFAGTEYTLTIVIASEAAPEKTRRYLLGGNVDGALVVSHHSGDHSYAQLGASLPVVFGGRPLTEEGGSYFVDVDNTGAARTVTEHLLGLGRTAPAMIASRQDMPAAIDRLAGWRSAVTAAGLDDSLVEYGDYSPEDGATAMRRLLDSGRPIDAVFASNDQMAAGALTALRERGLTVPGDIALAGFDGDYFAEASEPRLTTVRQPSTGLGEAMADVLVRLLAGEEVQRVTLLPTELLVRGSTVAGA